mmetsp:Transcript_50317/g.129591  ORF Transcript_50317/g.129591 Transcript_50317/m.129591 type:complete len:329 (-) Transcript_50317:296-1282(-)
MSTSSQRHLGSMGVDFSPPGPFHFDYTSRQRASLPVRALLAVKDVVFALTVVPVRVLLTIILIASCFIWFKLLKAVCPAGSSIPPSSVAFHCRVLLFALGFYWINVEGKRDDNAPLLISNHISYVDILVHAAFAKSGFISKASIKKLPLVGEMASSMGTIFVDRMAAKEGKATKSTTEQLCDALHSEKRENPIVVFPEGTTTNGKYLLKFRTGAFVPGLPVQPVLINYPYKYNCPSVAAISHRGIIFRLLSQAYQQLDYIFLPSIVPTEEEKKDAKKFATRAEKYISAELGVEMSSQGYIDKLILMEELGMPQKELPADKKPKQKKAE